VPEDDSGCRSQAAERSRWKEKAMTDFIVFIIDTLRGKVGSDAE